MSLFIRIFKRGTIFSLSKSSTRFCSSSGSATYMRQVNSFRLNRDELVENLCSKLHEKQPLKYSFLTENLGEVKNELLMNNSNEEIIELVSLLNSKSNENSQENAAKCLSLFESWVGKTKFNLAFYMFANRTIFHSEEFLTRLVLHLSPNIEKLNTEEMVALWLCLHFSNRTWTREELYEHLNFLTFQIQANLNLDILLHKGRHYVYCRDERLIINK